MGTQKNIADKIIKNDANYTLAVKANQPLLRENIEDEFRFNKKVNTHQDIDYGHGRIETRTCHVITDFIHMEEVDKWGLIDKS
jgi:predicted transposase YbfD/YdcC